MEIRSILFIKSSPGLDACPTAGPPEYAFAGRSNVGKSSLLNLLVNKRNLAKTSAMPGKTRLINHFLLNGSWYLVDLPGYGFARTGRTTRDLFVKTTGDYLLHRETLACLFILIDCRHKPLKSDLNFIEWAGSHQIPLALVFTKTDKLSAATLSKNLDVYRNELSQTWEKLPEIFTVSVLHRKGREEILEFIDRSNIVFHSG
jgi:GTP-binding protein